MCIRIYFVFLWESDDLRLLLQEKAVLTDLNGGLSLTIHPMVIASMHREVEVTRAASTSTGTSLRIC